jgi:hypothetical protein
MEKIVVGARTSLGKLERVSREIASRTGFSAVSLTAFILIGIRPILPLARVTQHRLGTWRRWHTIEVYAQRVTYLQFRSIYQRLIPQRGGAGRKSLRDEHVELLKLVNRLGGEPAWGNKESFWETVSKHWDRKRKSPRALAIAYHRLKKKESDSFFTIKEAEDGKKTR